jgi:hypothetical protein
MGANATNTGGTWAIWTQAGASRHQRDAIGTTLTTGLQIDNAQAATTGPTDQYSPAVCFKGTYWNGSAATAANAYLRARGEFLSSVEYSELEVRNEFSSSAFVSGYLYGSKYGTQGLLLGKSSSGTTQALKSLAVISGGACLFEYDNTSSFRVISAAAASVGQGGGTEQLRVDTSNVTLSVAMIPTTTNTLTVGSSTKVFNEVWARSHAGAEQTIAAAASININPSAGEYIRIALGATAITTITATNGKPAQKIIIAVIQDATGTRSISGWSASFVFDGTYTPTTTANKRDLLTFVWDATDSKYYECEKRILAI